MKITDRPAVAFLSAVVGAFAAGAGALVFLDERIDSRIPEAVTAAAEAGELRLTPEGELRAMFEGALLLYQGPCPAGSEDLTSLLDGRYVQVDDEVEDRLIRRDGDGSHMHAEEGAHSHNVTGMTDRLGGGERYGSNDRNAAHKDNRVKISGTAHSEGSVHNHGGGDHIHSSVGVRLCKVRA